MANRVAVPDRVQEMGLLDRIDYADAFVVDVRPDGRSVDDVVAKTFDAAPRWVRAIVRVAHGRVLGLKLDAAPEGTSPAPIPGWHRLRHEHSEVVYAVEGGLVTPRIVMTVSPTDVTMVTVIRYDGVAARAVWAVVGPVHRLVARLLLDRGARTAGSARPS